MVNFHNDCRVLSCCLGCHLAGIHWGIPLMTLPVWHSNDKTVHCLNDFKFLTVLMRFPSSVMTIGTHGSLWRISSRSRSRSRTLTSYWKMAWPLSSFTHLSIVSDLQCSKTNHGSENHSTWGLLSQSWAKLHKLFLKLKECQNSTIIFVKVKLPTFL